jgi:hypothetical protein
MTHWCSVLAFGRTYDLAKRTAEGALVSMRGEWLLVPWRHVEKVRERASFHRFGDAPWRSPEPMEGASL